MLCLWHLVWAVTWERPPTMWLVDVTVEYPRTRYTFHCAANDIRFGGMTGHLWLDPEQGWGEQQQNGVLALERYN